MNELEQIHAKLDELEPAWRAHGTAAEAIQRLANAAEWGDMGTMKIHVRNEIIYLRQVLAMELPPAAYKQLLTSVTRLHRIVS